MKLLRNNGEVLRSLGYGPDEQLAARRVDFSLVFPDEASRAAAVVRLTEIGFTCELSSEGVDPGTPETIAYKIMRPSAEAITEVEHSLDEVLRAYGAATDGWGFFEDTVH